MINNYPITIFDFNEQFAYSFFNAGSYFYNNEYFFYNFALSSGGNHFDLKNGSSSSYYFNSMSSFTNKLNASFFHERLSHI